MNVTLGLVLVLVLVRCQYTTISRGSRYSTNEPDLTAQKARKPLHKPGLMRRGEKMRIVKAGLCFSGPTAYPSNMYLAEITHGNKDYDSNVQAYQCRKATTHDEADLKYAIKVDASEIATTEEWNRAAPALLWDLFDKRPP